MKNALFGIYCIYTYNAPLKESKPSKKMQRKTFLMFDTNISLPNALLSEGFPSEKKKIKAIIPLVKR